MGEWIEIKEDEYLARRLKSRLSWASGLKSKEVTE